MIKNNVLVGDEDWLFLYNGGQNQFDYLRGKRKVSDLSVKNFISNILSRQEYFNSKDIIYKHVVFPSKPLLKINYIPSEYADISSLFLKYYQNEKSDNHVIYPLENLRRLENIHSTFHKYNTHNSDFGYFEIANVILKNISINSIKKKYTIFTKPVSGDLQEMLGLTNTNEEEFIQLEKMQCFLIDNKLFLPGNTNEVQIFHNKNSYTEKRLLIFGDSFFQGTLKFLKLYFKDILFVRSSYVHKDIVENFSPNIVLTGNAERYLSHVDSDRNANNFLFELYGKKGYYPSHEYINAFEAMMSYNYYKHIYNSFVNNLSFNGISKEDSPRSKIVISSDHSDPDILREVALYFKNKGDYDIAYPLIKEALHLRPEGPHLKIIFSELKQIITNNSKVDKMNRPIKKDIIVGLKNIFLKKWNKHK